MKTLTDEQWDVIRNAADDYARVTETGICKDCTVENGHRTCKEDLEEVASIRRVIAAVEKEG